MKMLFMHGFFHADPHPANILVRDPDRISLVDFGMTEQLTQRDREAAVRLLLDRRPTFARPISRHYAAELRAIHLAVNEVIWWRMAEAHAAWREQKGHAA